MRGVLVMYEGWCKRGVLGVYAPGPAHCVRVSVFFNANRNRIPVVTIFRFPRIWYVAASTRAT